MSEGSILIPRERLEPLVHRVRLSGSEWRVVIAVLLSPGPVSARHLAKQFRLAYSSVKRTVRGLVAWNVLEQTREGLKFQSDSTLWASPRGGERQ